MTTTTTTFTTTANTTTATTTITTATTTTIYPTVGVSYIVFIIDNEPVVMSLK